MFSHFISPTHNNVYFERQCKGLLGYDRKVNKKIPDRDKLSKSKMKYDLV